MLVSVRRIIDRLRHEPSRARELHQLGRRFDEAQPANQTSEAERGLALRVRRIKVRLAALLEGVTSCGSCSVHYPPPQGYWSGGHCCSGHTEDVFTDDEISALKLAGTRTRDLRAPRSAHAGCAFRGPQGCSLVPAHRPNICVRYVCRDLRRELHRRGLLDQVEQLEAEFAQAFKEFTETHQHLRAEREWADVVAAAHAAQSSAR